MKTLSERSDAFFRRHPRLLLLTVAVLALLVAVVLMAESKGPALVYRAF